MKMIDKILEDMYERPISGKTVASDAPDATAFISVDQNSIELCPNENTGIQVDEDGLKTLGKLSINSSMDKFSIGVLWQLNPVQMSYVPSTAATPIPTFLPSNPLSSVVSFANKLKALAGMI